MNTNIQNNAIEKLSTLKVGALFMDMGTGKTKVALDLIASKIKDTDYVLWLCPFSLKNEIESERIKWHPELHLDVIGVESIGASDRIYLETLEKVKQGRTFIVVDESLKIKNKRAKRTERILEMSKYAEFKLILNGTPISRNILDLWAQMEFLSPKILNMSFLEYRDNYCIYNTEGPMAFKVINQKNIPHLMSLINPYIFEASLELDVNKRYRSVLYELINIDEYESVKYEILERAEVSDLDFYEMISRLQHIYCRDNAYELKNLINRIDKPVVVFKKYLDNIPEDALSITGKTKLHDRNKILKHFKENGGALYLTYGCGAYGLNLQFCNDVIFAEHTWDYAQRIQAEARVHRIGQESDVTYYDLICNTGLESCIFNCIRKKTGFLNEVKRNINNKKSFIKSL